METEKPEKRPIDRKRDSAGSFKLGKPEDGNTVLTVEIKGSLYIVRERGIYAIQMADQIDPKRTNIDLPNVIPRHVFSEGSDSELVGKTFLTAATLLRKGRFIPDTISNETALSLSLDALTNMIGMRSAATEYDLAQQQASLAAQTASHESGTFQLPHIADAKSKFNTFTQRADHAAACLFGIVKLFHSEVGQRGWDGLLTLSRDKYGEDDNFTKFLSEAVPFLKMVRNMRDVVEHNLTQGQVTNYILLPEGITQLPSFEMDFRGSKIPLTAISALMSHLQYNLPICFEIMLAHLAGRNLELVRLPFPLGIGIPEEQRRPIKTVSYYYGTLANGVFTPIG